MATEDMAEGPQPAHIDTGTRDTLREVVAPLTDVAVTEGDRVGAKSTHAVKTSHTIVDMPLPEIIDGGNVHERADAIDAYIACGDIGGVVYDEGGLRLTCGILPLLLP